MNNYFMPYPFGYTTKKNKILRGIPCKIIAIKDDIYTLKVFNLVKPLQISLDELQSNFIKCDINNSIIITPVYPDGVPLKEFDLFCSGNFIDINKIKKSIIETTSIDIKESLKYLLDNFLSTTLRSSKGSKDLKISEILHLKNHKKYLCDDKSIKCIGKPFINRALRWSPPIDKCISRKKFVKLSQFGEPIGIRSGDFCFPSELNKLYCVILEQIFSFEDAPELNSDIISNCSKYYPEFNPIKGKHLCNWCHKPLYIKECLSIYGSKTNYVELCHIDPYGMTTSDNIYIGHGKCNREQGGYTENERCSQIGRLINSQEHIKHLIKELSDEMKKCLIDNLIKD